MKRTDDPRLLRTLVSHRVLVLSNTLALAVVRNYPRRFGVRVAEWRVIDALHAGSRRACTQCRAARRDRAGLAEEYQRACGRSDGIHGRTRTRSTDAGSTVN